ncbi:MAG: extracellular solute-binding protein [Firmicutes bacterium]|nr:extracellular solute-binding protein [Bacillota bacterium]
MKRLLRIALAAMMLAAFALASACGTKEDVIPNDENNLEIFVLDAGYGDKFVEELGKAFEALPGNSGKKVWVRSAVAFGQGELKLTSGATADLIIDAIGDYRKLLTMRNNKLPAGAVGLIADLTDVYNSPAYGETELIKDKMNRSFTDVFADGSGAQTKFYAFPWANDPNGLVYDKKFFTDNGISVPRTTDELVEVCDLILTKPGQTKPLIWAGGVGYWKYLTQVWWAQYEGLDNYLKFFNPDTNLDPVEFLQDGRLESLKALDKLINGQSSTIRNYSVAGSLSANFTQAQMDFLGGKAAMIPNGGWIENEMKGNYAPGSKNIAVMKTPIVSSLAAKLGITETELRAVVDYADNTASAKPAITPTGSLNADAVIDYIVEARKFVYSSAAEEVALVASYSPAIELAKNFLRFMASDAGIAIARQHAGILLPYDYDMDAITGLTDFQKSKRDVMKNAYFIMDGYQHSLFYKAGLLTYNQHKYQEQKLGAQSSTDYKSPQTIVNEEYDWVYSRWDNLKTTAGVN